MPEVRLVPGEMRLWTDMAPGAPRPPAGGRVLTEVALRAVRASGGRKVLVAGPHSTALVSALAGEADVTVVLRSLSDAERLAQETTETVPSVEVVCGGLDAYAATGPGAFDLVVALDGADRVLSNDSDVLAWAGRYSLLTRLADEGLLLLTFDNPFSLVSLADSRTPAERRDTGDWEPPPWTDHSRPGSRAALDSVLRGQMDLESTVWTLHPTVTEPVVVVDEDAEPDQDHARGLDFLPVRRALAEGARRAAAGRSFLFDPAEELMRAVATGRAAEVAAGWLVLVGRHEALVDGVLVEDRPGVPGSALVPVGGHDDAPDGDPLEGPLEGPLQRVGVSSVWRAGLVLAEELLNHVQAERLPEVRREIRAWLDWVEAQPADQRALCTPDDLRLDDEQRLSRIEPGWVWTEPVPVEVALARVTLAAARRLLAPDVRRIWPPWIGPAELARSLVAMADRSFDDVVWVEAVALDERIAAILETPVALDRDLVSDLRGLRLLNERLTTELESARGEIFAHRRLAENRDRQLEQRSAALAEARRKAETAELRAGLAESEREALRASLTYRTGRAIRHPGQAARFVANRLKRD